MSFSLNTRHKVHYEESITDVSRNTLLTTSNVVLKGVPLLTKFRALSKDDQDHYFNKSQREDILKGISIDKFDVSHLAAIIRAFGGLRHGPGSLLNLVGNLTEKRNRFEHNKHNLSLDRKQLHNKLNTIEVLCLKILKELKHHCSNATEVTLVNTEIANVTAKIANLKITADEETEEKTKELKQAAAQIPIVTTNLENAALRIPTVTTNLENAASRIPLVTTDLENTASKIIPIISDINDSATRNTNLTSDINDVAVKMTPLVVELQKAAKDNIQLTTELSKNVNHTKVLSNTVRENNQITTKLKNVAEENAQLTTELRGGIEDVKEASRTLKQHTSQHQETMAQSENLQMKHMDQKLDSIIQLIKDVVKSAEQPILRDRCDDLERHTHQKSTEKVIQDNFLELEEFTKQMILTVMYDSQQKTMRVLQEVQKQQLQDLKIEMQPQQGKKKILKLGQDPQLLQDRYNEPIAETMPQITNKMHENHSSLELVAQEMQIAETMQSSSDEIEKSNEHMVIVVQKVQERFNELEISAEKMEKVTQVSIEKLEELTKQMIQTELRDIINDAIKKLKESHQRQLQELKTQMQQQIKVLMDSHQGMEVLQKFQRQLKTQAKVHNDQVQDLRDQLQKQEQVHNDQVQDLRDQLQKQEQELSNSRQSTHKMLQTTQEVQKQVQDLMDQLQQQAKAPILPVKSNLTENSSKIAIPYDSNAETMSSKRKPPANTELGQEYLTAAGAGDLSEVQRLLDHHFQHLDRQIMKEAFDNAVRTEQPTDLVRLLEGAWDKKEEEEMEEKRRKVIPRHNGPVENGLVQNSPVHNSLVQNGPGQKDPTGPLCPGPLWNGQKVPEVGRFIPWPFMEEQKEKLRKEEEEREKKRRKECLEAAKAGDIWRVKGAFYDLNMKYLDIGTIQRALAIAEEARADQEVVDVIKKALEHKMKGK